MLVLQDVFFIYPLLLDHIPPVPDRSLEKPARHRRKEARPSEIIAAALQLFDEKGYTATRLEDVALRAGVSKGTIYLYFEGKEALFNAVVREGAATVLSWRKERLANDTGSSLNLLRDFVLDFSRMIGSDQAGGVLKLVLAEAGNFPDIAHAYHDRVIAPGIDLLREIIIRGMACGEFRSVDPELAAHIILALPLARIIWGHSFSHGLPGVPTEHYLAEHLDLILGGLCSGRQDTARWPAPP